MRTTISIAVTPRVVENTMKLAKKRGFPTVSEYLRFLLNEDDESYISEDNILRRGQEVDRLDRQGKLIRGKRLRDFVTS